MLLAQKRTLRYSKKAMYEDKRISEMDKRAAKF